MTKSQTCTNIKKNERLMKKLFKRIIDRIFGKRCECPTEFVKIPKPIKVCLLCGKTHIA